MPTDQGSLLAGVSLPVPVSLAVMVSVGLTAGARAQPQLSVVSVKPDRCRRCRRQVLAESHRHSIAGCRCRSLRSPRARVWLPRLSLSPGAACAVALQGTAVSAPACAGRCGPPSPRTLSSPCPAPWELPPTRGSRLAVGGQHDVGLGPPGCLPQIPAGV